MLGVVRANKGVGWAVVEVSESGRYDEFVFRNKIVKICSVYTLMFRVVVSDVE